LDVTELSQDGIMQTKSKERVRDLGEVFTAEREVKAMLDLVPDMFTNIDTRFFEPACGNGNFLVEILARKIELIDDSKKASEAGWFEYQLLRALASIYAVDISEENVEEARERMRDMVDAAHALHGEPMSATFLRAVDAILASNVIEGDSLNNAQSIIFIEYKPVENQAFARTPNFLEMPEMDLFFEPPAPLSTVHYSQLGEL
jgi:SAM-dependent methyltransferase